MFLSAFYRLGCNPSLTHSCKKYACHGLQTCRKTTTGESVYTFAINDNCPSYVFLLSDRLRTITRVSHLALPIPMISTALAPLLPSSSRILDSGICHGPSLFILRTILPHTSLAVVPYPTSSSTSLGRYFVVASGFVELPAPDLVSVSHAISAISNALA